MKREEFSTPSVEVVKFSEIDAILTVSGGSVGGRDPIELPDM